MESTHDEEQRDWAGLDLSIIHYIFLKLGVIEVLASARAVCRPWRNTARIRLPGRSIDMRSLSINTLFTLNRGNLAKAAVNRTTGPIQELHVMSVSHDFLQHISNDRITGLRCCSLIRTWDVSPKGLLDFLRRCPLLEELNIYCGPFLSETYRLIGQTCPELKRLSINGSYNSDTNIADSDSDYRTVKRSRKYGGIYGPPDSSDDPDSSSDSDTDSNSNSNNRHSIGNILAFEIANNMPQLRELRIVKELTLTDIGVHAILDKCIHLESLNLRCCFDVRVDKALHDKMAKIKTVTLSRRSVLKFNKRMCK